MNNKRKKFLFALLLTSVCVIFCEEVQILDSRVVNPKVILDKKEIERIISYCEGGENREEFEFFRVFDKYGETHEMLGQIRAWDIEKEERDERMNVSRRHSDLYDRTSAMQ